MSSPDKRTGPTIVIGATGDRSHLRIATGDHLAMSSDATQKAYEVIVWGMGETLMRISRKGKLVPWPAERLENVDPFTWRISLLPNARFWDGSPVSSQAVAASFRTNWTVQQDVASLISPQTRVSVLDELTLEFSTAQPVGNFPNGLAYHQFVIHKDDGKTMTGPYRPVAVHSNGALMLEPFREHWAGVPQIGRIEITDVPTMTCVSGRCWMARLTWSMA